MNGKDYLFENISLKTITPIYIGQNQANDISPYSDFVQIGNEILYIDEKKFEDALFSKKGLLDEYVKSIRKKIDKSRTQSDFDFKVFIENNFGEVSNFAKYRIPVDQDLKHQSIKRFINTSGRPYIPGSTIKGAIRTAIIFNWLTCTEEGKAIVAELIQIVKKISGEIEEQENRKKNNSLNETELKEIDRTLENPKSRKNIEKEFNSIYDEQKLFGKMSKENKDGFDSRYIQISDTTTFTNNDLSVLKLHRIKLRDSTEVSPLPSETLKPNIFGEFSFKLEKRFIQKNLEKFNSFTTKNIFKVINDFSLASIKYEVDTFTSFSNNQDNGLNYSEIVKFYKELQSRVENSKNEFAVIRLGSGKTFFDNSIGLAIFNNSKEVFKQYRILLELGKNPQTKKLVEGRFPTTRTLVEVTNMPIGWIAISSNKNTIESLSLYETKIISINITNNASPNSNPVQPKNYTLAKIIDVNSKPPKVKILVGEYSGKETILAGVNLRNLGFGVESKVNVELVFQKKVLQKADYKGKAD